MLGLGGELESHERAAEETSLTFLAAAGRHDLR
jgi:hypothetical protein